MSTIAGISEAEDRQTSEQRELAYLRNGHVVTALVVFSAPDVFGGQLSDLAVTSHFQGDPGSAC